MESSVSAASLAHRPDDSPLVNAAEARFFDASPEFGAILDRQGRFVRINVAASRLLGVEPGDLVGTDFTARVHPEDREGSLTAIRRVAKQQGRAQFQNRYRQASGAYRWLAWSAATDPETGFTFLSAHDVTVYQSTSHILRSSERRYRSLVSNLPGVVYRCTYDARWRTEYMSEGFEALTGYPVVEFLGPEGRPFSDLVEPSDVPLIQQTVRRAFETRTAFEVEYRIRHVDGSTRWVYDKGIVVGEENAWFLDGVLFDITERKRNEAQLRMLEAVVVNARDAVVVTDAEPIDAPGPTIVYVNDAFCEMTGFSREEVIGQTPRILHGPATDRAALDAIRHGLERWEPVHVEVLNYRKDGTPFWSDISIVPVADETGWFTHWISVQRDVSERKHDEERLRVLEAAVGDATESVLVTDADLEQPGPRIVYVTRK